MTASAFPEHVRSSPMWAAALAIGALGVVIVACTSQERVLPAGVAQIPDHPDYNWDIRPILSQNCFACHGNDKAKAGLRLDIAQNAHDELPESPGKRAIVRRNPGRSEIIRRVTSDDVDVRMPPKETHKTLSERDIAILERWISQGAEYKQHWAYLAPRAARIPDTAWDDRTVNPIDSFVFAKIEKAGLKPSPEADRETLINRLTLDLTGLPPTLAQVDAFLGDKSSGAYERLVDRLLASSHYAERQANVWLDVARYADSDGFQFDQTQVFLHPYRDWVISAFQRNMPYDQFATWQLAGDKLPNATQEQLIATAFGRAGKRGNEAGIIDEEYRVEYAAERAELVGMAFLGLTVGCAKCHDHKYDVISQRDYYSMFGFFNQVNERGISRASYGTVMGASLNMPSPKEASDLAAAQQVTQQKQATYYAVLQAARTAALPEAVQLASQSARIAFLQQASARDLQAYYPLDATYKGDLTPIKRGRDGQPLALANVATAGKLPEFEGEFFGGPSNVAALREADPGRPRLAGEELQKAAMEDPNSTFAFTLPPYEGPTMPAPLEEGKALWTASGVPGGKPAVVQNVKLVPGAKGLAIELARSIGAAYPGVGMFDRTDSFSLDVWIRPRADKPYEATSLIQNRTTGIFDDGTGYELHLQDNRPVFRMVHAKPYNSIVVIARSQVVAGRWTHITLTYDGSSKASGVQLYLDGKPAAVDIEQDQLTRNATGRGASGGGALSAGPPLGLAWGELSGISEFQGGALDEIKVFTRALTPLEVALGHDPAFLEKATPAEVQAHIAEILAQRSPQVVQARGELNKAIIAEQDVATPILQLMVMKDRPLYRKTYVLDRGLYNAPKLSEEVQAQGLSRVFPWSEEYRRDRLGLAQWLFDPKNPLTSRVFVNRMWQARFGTGIVETVEDFGTQGSNPTNPELLDWLAVEFQRSGWDIKHMHKLMVMSATYRQSSNFTPELLEKDPRNLLLTRGPRFRMPAEMIRDNALFASGLLVDKPGGDAVFPYQPAGVWDSIGVPVVPYPKNVPADQNHRRSMYTYIRRNAAYPSLTVFDMPDRNGSTVARRTSNTPLQALVLLNDTQYVEAYRKLAERALKVGGGDQRLVQLFRLATRRHPLPAELATMRDYLTTETNVLRRAPQQAEKLLAIGVAPRDSALDSVDLAAMTMLTAVVMNTPDAYSLR